MQIEVLWGSAWYSLTDGVVSTLRAYDGIGMAPIRNITEQSPEQHGATYIDRRLQPRTISLVLKVEDTAWALIEAKRALLYSYLGPIAGNELTFRFTTDGGYTRNIKAVLASGLDFPRTAGTGGLYTFMEGMNLLANDPLFWNPDGNSASFDPGGGSDAMEVPLAVPIEVGISTADVDKVLINSGQWYTRPFIRVTGPITDCILTNTTTGALLDFTGVTIAAADYYNITLNAKYPTLKDAAGSNKLGDLTATSDWGTFNLAPAPYVVDGYNNINLTGSAITAATKVEFQWFDYYLGI